MNVIYIETGLNLIGLSAFALSGAILGVQRQYDVVGIAVLASITALGGGVIRDVLIGDTPPTALRTTWWLAVPFAAALATFFFHPQLRRLRPAIQLFDAVGLGVFCAAGAAKAVDYGLGAMESVLMGAITGIGGGILRDILAGVPPVVLSRASKLYAIPAIAGSGAVVAGLQMGADSLIVQAGAASGIIGFRLLALRFDWTAPVPKARNS